MTKHESKTDFLHNIWRYWSALATAPAEASAVAKVAIIINNSS